MYSPYTEALERLRRRQERKWSVYIASKFQGHWKQGMQCDWASNVTNFPPDFVFAKWASSRFKVRELKQQRRRRRRQLKETIDLMIITTALHVHHTLSTFLWRPLHDYDVKPPNLTFYGGRGHTTTNFSSSFWNWIKPLRIQLQEKSPAFDILSGSK